MHWFEATFVETIRQGIIAATTTNPSSLTLAMIGVGTLILFYRLNRRSELRSRKLDRSKSKPAKIAKKRRAA